MKIYKITEASEYLGVSINTLKTLANNGKVKSFKTTGSAKRDSEKLNMYAAWLFDVIPEPEKKWILVGGMSLRKIPPLFFPAENTPPTPLPNQAFNTPPLPAEDTPPTPGKDAGETGELLPL